MTKEERINEITTKMQEEGDKLLNVELVQEKDKLSEWWLKLTDNERQEIIKNLESEEHKKYDRLMFLMNNKNLLNETGLKYVEELERIHLEHEVLENLKLVKGEVDIRKLSQEDINQLMWRTLVDQYQIQRNILMLFSDVAKVIYKLAERRGINIQDTLDKN